MNRFRRREEPDPERPSVLVTGGTGAFGRAFIADALKTDTWRRVISLSRSEARWAENEVLFGSHQAYRGILGDVRDFEKLRRVSYGVDVVIAAAALKRVEAGKYNQDEFLKTNVMGFENTVRAAVDAGASRVVLVSSDKAVEAANHYGVTKAMAEAIAIQSNVWAYPQGTRVGVARYGNVLGSTGSVVPLWRAQAAAGKPLTITDPAMTRFVMTLEQAVDTVLFTLETMHGGEIVVPVLASASMIHLAQAVAPGHPCVTIGLRAGGEKLAERLLTAAEIRRAAFDDRGYYVVRPEMHEWTAGDQWTSELLPADFLAYSSDSNDYWFDAPTLAAILSTVGG